MLGIKRFGFITAAVAMMTALAAPAAQAERPISIVVPYAAGGINDNFARMLAKGMGEELKRTIIVENKPGANGVIGANYVARAEPDGTTLLIGGTGPISLNVLLRPNLPFGFDSFESVALLFEGPLTLTVPTKLGVNSIPELVDYSKKNDQPLRYGTLGPGSVGDLYGLLVAKALDVNVLSVPYKNIPSSLIDLMGGLGDLSSATPIALVEHQKSGQVKMLAMSTKERDPSFPDVPSVTELGYPQLESTYWTSLHAPKGTPKELVEAYSAAAIKVVQSDDFRELLRRNGQMVKTGGPAALDAQIQADVDHWGAIIKENNIVLD